MILQTDQLTDQRTRPFIDLSMLTYILMILSTDHSQTVNIPISSSMTKALRTGQRKNGGKDGWTSGETIGRIYGLL